MSNRNGDSGEQAGGDSGKKARRDAAREKARLQREAERKRRQRNRRFAQGGIILAVLVVVGIVALVIYNGVANAPSTTSAGPANMRSDGILLTGNGTTISATRTPALKAGEKPVPTDQSAHSKTVNIVTYIDYQCPYCDEFETTNESQLTKWVTAGVATLEIHPIAILTSSANGGYSPRSANAAACVANYEPDKFWDVSKIFYANQPEEGTGGLPDSTIVSLVKKAGADNAKIPACITSDRFGTWVTDATNRALKGPLPNSNVSAVTGTPTVIVDGKSYTGSLTSASDFASVVEAAYAAKNPSAG